MATIFLSDDDDLFDIRRDNVFKAVFGKDTPESSGALSKLVSALIGRDVTIISLLANELSIENIQDRLLRFDINCRAESGELINVEMSLNPKSFEHIRMEFHVARLFSAQDIKGIHRNYNNLKQTYQITILAKGNFFDDEEFLHNFEYYDPEHQVSLNGRTRIISLELSKLERIVEKPVGEMSKSEQWAVFFEYLTHKEKRSRINEIVALEEGIAMASSVLVKVSKDEEERARIQRQEKTEMDWASYMAEAKEEGLQKGIEKGQEKERKKLLEMINQVNSLEELKQQLMSSQFLDVVSLDS